MVEEPSYSLPDGSAGFEYFPGGKNWSYDDNTDARGPVLSESVLDCYIARKAAYIESHKARTDAAKAKALKECNYKQKRQAEFPTVGDQLDAIWKTLDGMALPAESQAVLEDIKATKTKYPKIIGPTPMRL